MSTERIDAMYAAHVHVGYRRSRRHPSIRPFLFGLRNNIDIIHIEKTIEQVEAAKAFLAEVKASGKGILFVGTKAEVNQPLIQTAEKLGRPYVSKRWIGGTLTNFKEIRSRVKLLETLEEGTATNTLVYRTKKELLLLQRKLAKLDLNFGGLRELKQLPAAVVVIDPRKEHIAVAEAEALGIPVVAIASTDCDIANIAFPIVANDSLRASIDLLLGELFAALQ